jgi:hypothetical protein
MADNEETKVEGVNPLNRFMAMRQAANDARQANFAEESRKRLDKIISTKMNTTFIGALAAFEKHFGLLWGASKKESERTDEEKQLYQIWQNVRTEVLNNGNNQLRALRNELQNHSISWNRHNLVMSTKPLFDKEED